MAHPHSLKLSSPLRYSSFNKNYILLLADPNIHHRKPLHGPVRLCQFYSGGGGGCRNDANVKAIKADGRETLQRRERATPSSSDRGCRPVDLRQVDVIRGIREGRTAAGRLSCPASFRSRSDVTRADITILEGPTSHVCGAIGPPP